METGHDIDEPSTPTPAAGEKAMDMRTAVQRAAFKSDWKAIRNPPQLLARCNTDTRSLQYLLVNQRMDNTTVTLLSSEPKSSLVCRSLCRLMLIGPPITAKAAM